MAAPNTGLLSESFHATQTQVQAMYVIVHTHIETSCARVCATQQVGRDEAMHGLGLQSVKAEISGPHCSEY